MSDLSERFKNLSPEQQKLLKLRLDQRNRSKQKTPANPAPGPPRAKKDTRMDVSLFFFSADGTGSGSEKYRLLTDSTRFADQNGFKAVWTPERHFQAFGGLYPNPSVLNAALAVLTERVQLRAGSVVAPLHSPVRIAEEWALVDNLSNGRTGIAFATGWHAFDYVIMPDAYHDRREKMFRYIDIVRRLWRGETVSLSGVDGKETPVHTLPRPVQQELPYWVTASSPRTWAQAGEIGANVLSMMTITLDDMARNIKAYRQARIKNGHDPRKGVVTIMLHTYLDNDLERAREMTRAHMAAYLKNFLEQYRHLPGGDQFGDESGLLTFAVERYFNQASLLGSPEKCAAMIETLSGVGVNEVACLIDFGIEHDDVLKSLELLTGLRERYQPESEE